MSDTGRRPDFCADGADRDRQQPARTRQSGAAGACRNQRRRDVVVRFAAQIPIRSISADWSKAAPCRRCNSPWSTPRRSPADNLGGSFTAPTGTGFTITGNDLPSSLAPGAELSGPVCLGEDERHRLERHDHDVRSDGRQRQRLLGGANAHHARHRRLGDGGGEPTGQHARRRSFSRMRMSAGPTASMSASPIRRRQARPIST